MLEIAWNAPLLLYNNEKNGDGARTNKLSRHLHVALPGIVAAFEIVYILCCNRTLKKSKTAVHNGGRWLPSPFHPFL